MGITDLLARQMRRPSGFLGKYCLVPLMKRANAPINRLAGELVGAKPGDRIMEVGFGGGDLLAEFLERINGRGRILGVDFSETVILQARKRFRKQIEAGQLELHLGSFEGMSRNQEGFDAVCMVNTIYFSRDLQVVFEQVKGFLKPNGRLIVGFREREQMERLAITRTGVFHLYASDEVVSCLKQAGYSSVEVHRQKAGIIVENLCAVAIRNAC